MMSFEMNFCALQNAVKWKKKKKHHIHISGGADTVYFVYYKQKHRAKLNIYYKYYAMWKENLCSMKLEIMSHMWNSISVFMHHNNIMEHIIDIVLGGK
jgi:hypothetical protein